MALYRKPEGFQSALSKVSIRFRPAQRAARIRNQTVRVAPRFAGAFIRVGLLGQLALQCFMRSPCAIGALACLLQRLLQHFQPVQLLQTQRCSRRRVLSPSAKAVPTPQIALGRDQPLPRQQLRLQPRTRVRIDQPDLAHAALEHLRDRDMLRQRRHPLRQGLRLQVPREYRPARRTICINLRGPQIVCQGCAKCLFKPMFNLQPVEDLPALSRVTLHQLRQRCGFGAQGIGFAFGLRSLRAGVGLARLCLSARFFGGQEGRIGSGSGSDSGGFGLLRLGKVHTGFVERRLALRHGITGLAGFGL